MNNTDPQTTFKDASPSATHDVLLPQSKPKSPGPSVTPQVAQAQHSHPPGPDGELTGQLIYSSDETVGKSTALSSFSLPLPTSTQHHIISHSSRRSQVEDTEVKLAEISTDHSDTTQTFAHTIQAEPDSFSQPKIPQPSTSTDPVDFSNSPSSTITPIQQAAALTTQKEDSTLSKETSMNISIQPINTRSKPTIQQY